MACVHLPTTFPHGCLSSHSSIFGRVADCWKAIFGMNVDVFRKEPRLKWFLIAAAVLLVVVITALLGFRTLKRSKRKRPAGIYSALRGLVI